MWVESKQFSFGVDNQMQFEAKVPANTLWACARQGTQTLIGVESMKDIPVTSPLRVQKTT